jgi:hypothetical protein
MDYQLENLGPDRFQLLSQALLVQEYPGVQCLPIAQPDGGRDAIGFIDSSRTEFNVFQVKFARDPRKIDSPFDWFQETIDKEIDKIRVLRERGAKVYTIITNLAGTAHLDAGSIDKIQKYLNDALPLPARCWWRDDINRRLDGSWDIKLRYPEVLTGQDYPATIPLRPMSRQQRFWSIGHLKRFWRIWCNIIAAVWILT